jgi:hypothetical protein
LDEARNFDPFDATFKIEGRARSYLTIAVGIAKQDYERDYDAARC